MAESIALPVPRLKSKLSIEQALSARRSRRAYAPAPVTLAEAGQLLWAAQGVTGPKCSAQRHRPERCFRSRFIFRRPAWMELAPGVYLYDPESHRLTEHLPGDRRRDLTAAAADQDSMRFSGCALILAAVVERCAVKYGERAGRLIALEAGHAAQNVYLQASALEFGRLRGGDVFGAGCARGGATARRSGAGVPVDCLGRPANPGR